MTKTQENSLPAPAHRGKVRDVYDLGERLLLVATDRVSAFDVILNEPIVDKGRLLTAISAWWFDTTAAEFPNHLVSIDSADFPPPFNNVDELRGRSALVWKAERVDIECIVRGYLAGSGWAEYRESGSCYGHELPAGLNKGSRLPEPLFTPTTKEDEGHDQPISFAEMEDQIGAELAQELRDISLRLYARGHEIAEERGFLLADTKFEFGKRNGEIILIDEVLTPDSSRYWKKEDYREGSPPESWDKQVIRDYLETTQWNKQPPAPTLPEEICHRAQERYRHVHLALTGNDL